MPESRQIAYNREPYNFDSYTEAQGNGYYANNHNFYAQREASEANTTVPPYGYNTEGPDFNSHTGSYTKTEPYHNLPPIMEEDPEDHEEANA